MYKVGAAHDDDRKKKTLVAEHELKLAANVARCWVPPLQKNLFVKTTKQYCILHDSMTVRSKKPICMNDLLRARISKWVLYVAWNIIIFFEQIAVILRRDSTSKVYKSQCSRSHQCCCAFLSTISFQLLRCALHYNIYSHCWGVFLM